MKINSLTSILLYFVVLCFLNSCAVQDSKYYGAKENPKIKVIGGGEDYTRILNPRQNTFYVGNKREFLIALSSIKPSQTIYISDKAEIDLSGLEEIKIPLNITIASGRGRNGSKGALLYTRELKTFPLFITDGSESRITGIRFQGPDTLRRTSQMKQLFNEDKYYSIPNSIGIQIEHNNIEIDNCELYGWSHSAVYIKSSALGNYIHHNYIHHNQREGLGYGITIRKGDALIEANTFDWNRHHIAGSGFKECSYEACYNIVLPNSSSHAFDMHGGKDRKDGTSTAGGSIKIHHNTFYTEKYKSIIIRGVPNQEVEIYNNTFKADSSKSIEQKNASGKMKIYNNKFSAKFN